MKFRVAIAEDLSKCRDLSRGGVEAILARFEHLEIGRTARSALFSGFMATIGVVAFWGFTVDDALITARIAHHIATGLGCRFNPSGSIVDAVTPLGWAHVLAPFAQRGPLGAFLAARLLGVGLWIGSATWLGASVARRNGTAWPLVSLACLSPVGLWASAGMETAVVTALVTFATAAGALGSCCLSLAAAWRPELIPFAFALTLGRAKNLHHLPRDLAVVVGPAMLVAIIRGVFFGSAYPLAVVAKPSDLTHGFWYALEAMLWSGPLWLWLAPGWPFVELGRDRSTPLTAAAQLARFARRLPGLPAFERHDAALAFAIIVHSIAVMLAGGDWMPAYRLLVPVMPAMLRVACHVPPGRGRLLGCFGIGAAMLSMLHIATKLGPSARHIVEQRRVLIRAASDALNDASVVATPDAGWVGVAFPRDVVDLAGATDPAVAYLRGGHTSKQIGERLFISRHVDRVVVLLAPGTTLKSPWTDSRFARAIDYRAAMLAAGLGCAPRQTLSLPYTEQWYVVLSCRDQHDPVLQGPGLHGNREREFGFGRSGVE